MNDEKLSCLFLCLAVAASGLARGRHTEPMAMDISGPPRLVIADDSVTVILRVKVPDEMTRNREVHHKFHIHLVSERNSDDQVYVSTIHMRGKKRTRVNARALRRSGETENVRWRESYRDRKLRREPVDLSVKVATPDWMNPRVKVRVYVKQENSPRIDIPLHEYAYEPLRPVYEDRY